MGRMCEFECEVGSETCEELYIAKQHCIPYKMDLNHNRYTYSNPKGKMFLGSMITLIKSIIYQEYYRKK